MLQIPQQRRHWKDSGYAVPDAWVNAILDWWEDSPGSAWAGHAFPVRTAGHRLPEKPRADTGFPLGAERKNPCAMQCIQTMLPILMPQHLGKFVIIQSRSAQASIIPGKAQGLHQMQARPGVGAEPDDIAGIGRDFRFIKDDMQKSSGMGSDRFAQGAGQNPDINTLHPHIFQ